MPDNIQRLCPICRDAEIELNPYRSGSLSVKPSPLSVSESFLETEIYVCPRCRYAAFFAPLTPVEEFEKQQALQDSLSPVEKFERTFRDYTEKQLQKVIDGKNYVVTEDSAAAASNAITGVKVYPAMPDIKDNADVTLAGSHTANLGFHPSAFAFVTRPLVNPSGVESYVTSYNGVSLRVVKGYNMQYKKETLSMDVLYGYKTMYPELAVRAMG